MATRAGEIAAELATHFEAGRDIKRAVHHLQRAGENALQRYANQEAIGHLTKGLGFLKPLLIPLSLFNKIVAPDGPGSSIDRD